MKHSLAIIVATICSIVACGCRNTPSHRSIAQSIGQIAESQMYRQAAVAADHPLASQAGLEMLKRGGNAVDAAVATSFCLSVVRPYSCGIGGGGFMLIYVPPRNGQPAQSIALNYRESCPAAIGADHFAALNDPNASRFGAHAVAVPGTVAGLCFALKKYGTLDLPTVLAPAIRAAEEGVPADANYVSAAHELATLLAHNRALETTASAIWMRLCLSGRVKIGDVIKQPDQAKALRLIAEHGESAFYRGDIARAIVELMRAAGGPMTLDDLAAFRVKEQVPLQSTFKGRQILSMPPPSSGGLAMQQVFGIIERRWDDLPAPAQRGSAYIHLVVEAFKHAFADRSEWLADPDAVEVPVARLTDRGYIDRLARRVSMDHVLDNPFDYGSIVSAENPIPLDSGTSHFSVIDEQGMAVACTETINLNYGSLLTVPGYGFALNDEMDDFTTRPGESNAFGLRQSTRNLPAAGKRPLSSMSPTIVVKDGKAEIVAGGSGGPRIITATIECILNCLLFGASPGESVSAPRFHHQWMPDSLQFEPKLADRALIDDLTRLGHRVEVTDVPAQVQLIQVTPAGIQAACDPRKGGRPAGY